MGMGKDLLLCLKKHNNWWRMDHETLLRFMSFASVYFRVDELIRALEIDRVLYADISNEDLKIACVLFGTYAPNKETLYLVPVYPHLFITPWYKSFVLKVHLDGEDSLETTVMPLMMMAQ